MWNIVNTIKRPDFSSIYDYLQKSLYESEITEYIISDGLHN